MFLNSASVLAAQINLSNITTTNAVKTNDAILVNANLGGGVWATRTATKQAVFGDPFKVTSLLEDNATNVAMIVRSSADWTTPGQKLLSFYNGSTNMSSITQYGGLAMGSGLDLWGAPGASDSILIFRQADLDDLTSTSIYSEIIGNGDWTNGATFSVTQNVNTPEAPAARIDLGSYGGSSNINLVVLMKPGDSYIKMFSGATTLFLVQDGVATVSSGFKVGSTAGLATTWTNIISGVITQRITSVGGIIVTNLTL